MNRGRLLPLAAALVAAAAAGCARRGGASRGSAISASGDPPRLALCRAQVGDEHDRSEVLASTLAGLGERRVAPRAGVAAGVRFDPADGGVVAFSRRLRRDDPASTELWLAAVDGAFVQRITDNQARDESPTFSDDGRQVLFVSDRGGRRQLWRHDRDRDRTSVLTMPPVDAEDVDPDQRGGRVVFSRIEQVGGRRLARLWSIAADGSDPVRLTDGPDDRQPALAPDGAAVAFIRGGSGGAGRLTVLDIATNRTRDAGSRAAERCPRFTPRGDRLLVIASDPPNGHLGWRLHDRAVDGSDDVLRTLDPRYTLDGFDLARDLPAFVPPDPAALAADLDTDSVLVLAGRRTLGNAGQLRDVDGAGVQIATLPFAAGEAAGLYAQLDLPIAAASDAARIEVEVTAALSRPLAEARLRVSVHNYVRKRAEVAWEKTPTSTAMQRASFTLASLAHVDSAARVRIEVGAELPEGVRGELAVDAISVRVFVD